jgi:hypothetical protein
MPLLSIVILSKRSLRREKPALSEAEGDLGEPRVSTERALRER